MEYLWYGSVWKGYQGSGAGFTTQRGVMGQTPEGPRVNRECNSQKVFYNTRKENPRTIVWPSLHRVSSGRGTGTERGAHSDTQCPQGQTGLSRTWMTSACHEDERVSQNLRLVSRSGPNGRSIYPALPPLPSCDTRTWTWTTENVPLPSDPWKEVGMDLWGPTNSGEYLLVVVCKQTRWELEFVSSTCARAVIPKLDQIFSLGIWMSVDSNNGPLCSWQEFQDFSKYLGFKHERKTPKNGDR